MPPKKKKPLSSKYHPIKPKAKRKVRAPKRPFVIREEKEIPLIPVRTINRDECEHAWKEYKLGDLLGSGGSGRVYELCDEKDRCPYALKVENLAEGASLEAFIEEVEYQHKARAFAPKIYDAWICTTPTNKYGYGFIVMERMDGTLDDGVFPFTDKSFKILESYVRRLHKMGISHGDIRAPNIFYKGKWLYLGDFSHAEPYDPDDETDEDQLMQL